MLVRGRGVGGELLTCDYSGAAEIEGVGCWTQLVANVLLSICRCIALEMRLERWSYAVFSDQGEAC